MKKALDLILVYLVILIVGIVCSTFLYSFYVGVLNYIAGAKFDIFSNEVLINSLGFVSYCILLVVCPVVSYYRIRRPGGVMQTIGYILIVLITWIVLFPGLCHLNEFFTRNVESEIEQVTLSKNYFRKVDNKVYYFTKEFESENHNVATSNAVVIDTSETGKVDYRLVRDLNSMDFKKKALPFKDVLVKQNFDNSRVTLPINFRNLLEKLKLCLTFKLCYILYFISFALVISSVYALTNFFNWKLLNAVLIFFITVSIISVNSTGVNSFAGTIISSLENTAPFRFLSQYIYESFLFVFNTFFSLVFITIGIVKFAIHVHGKKN